MREWQTNIGQIPTLIILAIVALGFYLCYALARPFLPSLTFALALGVLLLPLHRKVEAFVPWPSAAAIISLIVAGIAIVGPSLFVAHQLGQEAAIGAGYLEKFLRGAPWRESAGGYPRIAEAVTWFEQRLNPAGILADLAAWLTSRSAVLLRGSITQLVNGLLTFYLLFYFLRDRRAALKLLHDISPLTDVETDDVIGRIADTVRATIFGTVFVAAIQGALGGLMFRWLGLPSPVLWGIVMGLLAVVPVLGAFIVWVPAAIFLAIEGDWLKAAILAAWGGGVVATIDNLLFPVLVGNRLRLHTVPTFIGIVGGIVVFGMSGLILGPVVISVTQILLEILRKRFGSEVA